MQCAAECDQATARAVCSCGLPEVFHLDRDRWRVDLRRAGGAIMPADRSQVFRLQANDAIYWKCFRG